MLKFRLNYLFIFIVAIILSGCAKRVAPPGGPEDKSPPIILSSIPADNSTNVPVDIQIKIEFDEPIDIGENAIMIFPEPAKISQKIHRKSIEIKFGQSLDKNTTYSILITPKLADRHGNNIKKPLEIAFSTGDILDTLEIIGYVFDAISLKPIEGAIIAAYTDSIAENRPLKISFSTPDGKFTIGHLPDEKIWLYSANSKNKIDWETAENISTPNIPVQPSSKGKVYISLIPNDTIAPSVISIISTDSFTAKLNFSEHIIPDSLGDIAKTIWFDPADSKSVYLRKPVKILGSKSKIKICDLLGNCVDTTIEIPEESSIDTVPPGIILTGKKRIGIPPLNQLHITFSEPANAKLLATIEDTAVLFERAYTSPNAIILLFDKLLPMGESLTVILDSFCDDFGNCTADTLKYDIEKTRLGDVKLSSAFECESSVYFLWNGSKKYRLKRDDNKYFISVLPGKYSLFRFCDTDRNGRWTQGSMKNFKYSEIFEFYPDTISVRGGWQTQINW
ncbi:Ig-like domain-containing protein [bacterium]|nr:Ig-like domain-containing protein [bacterium]